jgi:hypothetical protein
MENKENTLIAQEVIKVLERLEDSKQKDFWETFNNIKTEYNEIIINSQEGFEPA